MFVVVFLPGRILLEVKALHEREGRSMGPIRTVHTHDPTFGDSIPWNYSTRLLAGLRTLQPRSVARRKAGALANSLRSGRGQRAL